MKWIDPELFLETLGFFSPCFRVSCTLALLLKFWHDGKAFCWGSELFIPPKMAHRAHSYWMFMDVHGIKLIALRDWTDPTIYWDCETKAGVSEKHMHVMIWLTIPVDGWVGTGRCPKCANSENIRYLSLTWNLKMVPNMILLDMAIVGFRWNFGVHITQSNLFFDFFLRCANRRAWSCGASAHPPTKRLHLPSECPVIMTWGCCTQAALVLPSGNLT